jgi:energy-coupling factor transporter ATP-binding protein EcfA2
MKKEDFGDLNLLTISDFRSIDMFELKLENGKFVPLYGPNGSGKSSVMDSLIMLFNGGSVPEGSIRNGKDEAKVTVETTAGYKITKRLRKVQKGKDQGKQTTELVMTKDNQPVGKAQSVLKDLFAGFLTPNKIAMATGADLYNKIIKAAGISPEEIDNEIENAKKHLSQAEQQSSILWGIAQKPNSEKPEEIVEYDPDEIVVLNEERIKYAHSAEEYLRQNELKKELEKDIEDTRKTLENLVAELQEKNKVIEKVKERAEIATVKVDEIEKRLEVLRSARDNAEIMRAWKLYEENKAKAEEFEPTLQMRKETVKALRADRKRLIEELDTGVDGLSLTADGKVMFNDHQWEIAAFSERMKAAAILSLKNLPDDKLPIMFIEHGESLSASKREEIAKVAIDQGAIVFVEVMMEDTTGVNDGVIMRVSDTAPVIPEPVNKEDIPHHEVIESIQKQAIEHFDNKPVFDPMSVDLSGDLSKYSQSEITEALEAQRDHSNDNIYTFGGEEKKSLDEIKRDYPAIGAQLEREVSGNSPEELGMKKAAEIPVPKTSEPPALDFGFSFDEPELVENKQPEKAPVSDDPWENLDIF